MEGNRTETLRVLGIVEGRQLAASGAGRMLREAAGLSLADVARVVGVNPATVFRWESGEKRPYGDRAIAYRDFLTELREAHAGRRRVPA